MTPNGGDGLMRWKIFPGGKFCSQGGRICHDSFESDREFSKLIKLVLEVSGPASAAEREKNR